MLAAGPETTLAAVWSRNAMHSEELAQHFQIPVASTFDELLDLCDAVAFCVAPVAQPGLAVRAAQRGKPMLLEKPLALDLAGAEAVVAAIDRAGVGNVAVLTNRFAHPVRTFLAAAEQFDAFGARACFLSGAFSQGPFATSPWRKEHGALLDVGPHIFDLVDAAMGPVISVHAHGSSGELITTVLSHESGATSSVDICCTSPGTSKTELELFGAQGRLTLDARASDPAATMATLRADFAAACRGTWHAVNAARLLHVQRIIEAAARSLEARGSHQIVTRDG